MELCLTRLDNFFSAWDILNIWSPILHTNKNR